MSTISTILSFRMGESDYQKLIDNAKKAEENKDFSNAITMVNKAIGLCESYDETEQLLAYLGRLEKNEKAYKSWDSKNKILEALKLSGLRYAKKLYGAQRNNLREDDNVEICKEIEYAEYLEAAKIALAKKDLYQATVCASKFMILYYPPKEDAYELYDKICQSKNESTIDNNKLGPQMIVPFGTLNVPKKENEGEDAPPIFLVDSNCNSGFVGVFDGMGGAGAKKYKHFETGEEHTAAYWGSRIVRDCVCSLIQNRNHEISPIQWVDEHLHETIKKQLDARIKDFPNASGTVLSKMTRKLPTTMAMSGYEISDGNAEIATYWAGDSRVYVLLKDTIKILTIDDADAEDGDPFSPINMDLAMNNAISQERDFRINRSVVKLPISLQAPFLLIASTDGCFGYYKNPIEFEAMLRNCLGNANDCNEYLNNIKDAIIENIQQDDFSISIAGFGGNVFEDYKSVLSADANVELIKEYYRWREDVEKQRSDFKSRISDIETQLKVSREEEERLHSIEEQKNLEWYAKYKETFTVINREDIESI